jgi:hypothetical protein
LFFVKYVTVFIGNKEGCTTYVDMKQVRKENKANDRDKGKRQGKHKAMTTVPPKRDCGLFNSG